MKGRETLQLTQRSAVDDNAEPTASPIIWAAECTQKYNIFSFEISFDLFIYQILNTVGQNHL
jgi:hypothetical protein